ncbi:hypothetical protein JG688_00017219, partial [Phytophthora aleatoria]
MRKYFARSLTFAPRRSSSQALHQHSGRQDCCDDFKSSGRKSTAGASRGAKGLRVGVIKLQSADGVSLLDVRDLFDALIEQHPSLSDYLSADAAIVHDQEFESACFSVLMGESDRLRAGQRVLLRPFET